MNSMNIKQCISAFLLFVLLLTGSYAGDKPPHETQRFKDYWYAGKAEITTYELKQARYGELHEGYAVLIFVTEDLSESKHVKLDNPKKAPDDAVKVMKLNLLKKFNTGIYDYSIMESVFTPVDLNKYPHTLKLTMSSQEWCGHVFTQMNLKDKSYEVSSYSYFETEGDRDYTLDRAFLEDEIWTRIRINPQSLPVGKIKLIPNVIISRLKHDDPGIVEAVAELRTSPDSDEVMVYSVKFPYSFREFNVFFNMEFPHEIISWNKTYMSGSGDREIPLTTTAKKKESVFTDYWNKNSTRDVKLRKKLGIE